MSNHTDVGEFHQKFRLANTNYEVTKPHLIQNDLAEFRVRFLAEELEEIKEGYREGNLVKVADGLIDLVYVALGTAHLHHLPWEHLWREVQHANMAKERCEINHAFVPMPGPGLPDSCGVGNCHHRDDNGYCAQPRHKHSLRGNINDVIKPPGWVAPNVAGVLIKCGWPGPPLPLEPVTR